MKHACYWLLAFITIPVYSVFASPGCQSSAACAAVPASVSPFLEASINPEPAQDAAQTDERIKKRAPQPAAVQISTVSAVPVSGLQPASASNPLWVLFAVGVLAGLYLYLKQDSGKRRRK